jgi:hypothetical protein
MDGKEPLIAFPLVLPMGWTNSSPIFSTALETIADLTNHCIRHNMDHLSHALCNLAESISSPCLLSTLSPPVVTVAPDGQDAFQSQAATPWSIAPDPSFPFSSQPLAYIDVFVDDFIGLTQLHYSSCCICWVLLIVPLMMCSK